MSWWPRGDDGDEAMLQDTDSDVAEQKDGGKGKVKWTQEEDDKLKALVQKLGTQDWKVISSYIHNHTEHQCQHRWQKVLDPELVKGPWTKEEDEKVIELVNLYGNKQWALVARHLKGRLGKQCRERWHNHLNPNVKKCSWTAEEDLIIYKAHCLLGNRWAEIAKLLPGRTDNAVKNHWNSTIKRKLEMGFFAGEEFSPNELEELLADVNKDAQLASCTQEGPDKDPEQNTYPSELSVSDKAEPSEAEHPSPAPSPGGSLSSDAEADATGQMSSTSWVVDSSGFLAPTDPVLKEVLEMVDGDLDSWCNIEAFDLPDDSHSPERHLFRLVGSALQELSKGNKGELIPISPGGVTPPSILTRRNRRRINLSPDADHSRTPKSTPVKILPFSPSQFLNMWTKQDSHDLENPSLTSTPVCSQKAIVTTPLQRDKTPLMQKENSSVETAMNHVSALQDGHRTCLLHPNVKTMLCTTPRTPTPFKNAMEKYGALLPLPQTPNREEDINEVILRDSEIDLVVVRCTPPEQKRKSSHRPPMKKVRKSLALDVMDRQQEEPILVSLSCSALRRQKSENILDQGFLLGPSDNAFISNTVSPAPMSKEWTTIACGQTKDQLFMTEKARRYLRTRKSHPPNRALILS